MNQPSVQNPDLQQNKVTEPQSVNCCPEDVIDGNENRAIQGDENLAVQGDGNTVGQNSNNLNGSGSHFIKNMQADQISFININYLEGSSEKINGTQVSVEKKEGTNNKGKATFVFTGTINIVDEKLLKALEAHLRKIAKDTELTIIKVEEGSIKITLEASQETLELLKNLFESGELTDVLDIPIEDVQILSQNPNDYEDKKLDDTVIDETTRISTDRDLVRDIDNPEKPVFVYEVEGLQQNEQTENNTIQIQVPYSRLNEEMQRINSLGGRIVSIRPLSQSSEDYKYNKLGDSLAYRSTEISTNRHFVRKINNPEKRVFVYEVEGLRQNEQTENNKSQIRNSSRIQIQVPYSRMNEEIRRITRLGGRIVGIRSVSESSIEQVATMTNNQGRFSIGGSVGGNINNVQGDNNKVVQGDTTMTGARNINTGGGNYNERIQGDYVQGNYYAAGQPQSLAEAAAEIQLLLKQLEQTYPITTTSQQMVVAAEAINRIESNPTLKKRVINAVKEGGLAAFEKAIDNPAGAFIIGAIKGWQEVDAED